MNVFLRFFLILLLAAGVSWQTSPTQAQGGSAVIFGALEIDHFPTIGFHIDVLGPEGNFLNKLRPENFEILENGKPVIPQAVEEVDNGLQIMIALNTSPALSTQTNGISEYQRIIQALENWAGSQPAQNLDDFSLSTPTGLFLIRERDPKKLGQALTDYKPDLAKSQPNLNSLSETLDLATDPLNRPLMKRSILFITPPLPAGNLTSLPDLAARANKIGVRVNVWRVGPAGSAAENAPDPLKEFAEATGGKYAHILPSSALPEIEPIFLPQRHTYHIFYQSIILKSGPQALQVKVNIAATSIKSEPIQFDLAVEPPNPIFLSPPTQIQRTWTNSTQKSGPAVLTPDSVTLQILIEFPDKHPRPLKSTRLFVNGQIVGENKAEPFDKFEWPIADLTSSAKHLLRVEVVDSLSLTGSSIEVPVEIQVAQPVKTSLFDHISERGMVAVGAVAVSGATLAMILFLTNTQRRLRWKRQQSIKNLDKDPVTQPVPVTPVASRKNRSRFWRGREPAAQLASLWPRPGTPNAPARLVALDEDEQPLTGGIIALSRQEITFGSDPKRATQVLNSPTVDGLHARLFRSPEGEFFLADQGSIAGSWINYAPVTSSGARLEHGDLIHIGKAMFRFEVTDPAQVKPAEIKVINVEPPDDSR